MDMNAGIALGSAVVALISLLVTIYFASDARRSVRRAQDISVGQAETSLRSAISATRQPIRGLSTDVTALMNGRRRDQLNAEEKRKLSAFEGPLKEAVEDNLNAYEDACAKYRDDKIDKERFKKMYIREVQNLCECTSESPMHSFMHPEGNSKYQAIWKVYREWHHHEK